MRTKIALLIILILVSVVSVSAVEETNMVPKFEILDINKNVLTSPFMNDKDILIKLTLVNNKDFWICLNEGTYSINYNFGGKQEYSQLPFSHPLLEDCLSPNSEKNILIPFEHYNQLSEDQRVGEWTLTIGLSLRNLKCLKTKDNKFESYNNCDTSVSSSSNPKKINVVKPEPEVKPNYFVNLWKKISLGWKLFI